MGTLHDICKRIREEKGRVIGEQLVRISAAFDQRMKDALVGFLTNVQNTKSEHVRKFGCVVDTKNGPAVRCMFRLGVLADAEYGDVYFFEGKFYRELRAGDEALFQTSGERRILGNLDEAIAEVHELTESEITRALLTEHCLTYLDHHYGEEKTSRARDAIPVPA